MSAAWLPSSDFPVVHGGGGALGKLGQDSVEFSPGATGKYSCDEHLGDVEAVKRQGFKGKG